MYVGMLVAKVIAIPVISPTPLKLLEILRLGSSAERGRSAIELPRNLDEWNANSLWYLFGLRWDVPAEYFCLQLMGGIQLRTRNDKLDFDES
jgi:hypothetical protein